MFIPLPDGLRLAATIWMPEDAPADPVPAILELIPYRRRDGTFGRDHRIHPYIAAAGFACCRVDIRGSGDSEGLLHDEYTAQEQDDACEIITWLAAQPWCTGKVGMTGISWGGFNALQVAARRPPALHAIIALCCSDDRYTDDVHYFGGCLLTEDTMWSAFMLALGALPPDPQIVGEAWRTMWQERLDSTRCWSDTWMRHQRRDAYWRHGSVAEDYTAIQVPVYAISGWDDTYTNAVFRLVRNLPGQRKGLVGPWSHAYPCMGAPGPAIGYLQEAIRWWRHWLKAEPTGIMDEPQLTAWIMAPHAPAPFYADHPGRFGAEPAWPSPHTIWRTLHLNAAGLEDEPAPGPAMVLRSPVTAGRDCGRFGGYGGTVPDMALDQRREAGAGLCFDTAPLAEDFDLLGAPALEITAIADVASAFIAALLSDVAPDGTATLLGWGALNLAHRAGSETPAALVPGEMFAARFDLNFLGQRLPAGHRLRLVLTNQHWPILWPSPTQPSFTIESGGCRLHLPLRMPTPGEPAPVFAPPEMAPPVPLEELAPETHRRDIATDVGTGRQVITLLSDYGRQRILDRAMVSASRVTDRFSITEGDPLSARLDTGWIIAFESADAVVETESAVTLTADARSFHLVWKLEARERGATVLVREGESWIDREFV